MRHKIILIRAKMKIIHRMNKIPSQKVIKKLKMKE